MRHHWYAHWRRVAVRARAAARKGLAMSYEECEAAAYVCQIAIMLRSASPDPRIAAFTFPRPSAEHNRLVASAEKLATLASSN